VDRKIFRHKITGTLNATVPLGQLRSLFGEALEEPDARFELEVALRFRSAGWG